MDLNRLQKQCKKEMTFIINRYGDQRFLTNNIIAANVSEKAPTWSIDDFMTSAEIDPDERDDYLTDYAEYAELDYKDTKPLEVLQYTINIKDVELQPLLTDDMQVLFADCAMLRIFKDDNKDFRVGNLNDKPVIFLTWFEKIIGILTPTAVNLKSVQKFANALVTGSRNSRRDGLYDIGGQLSLLDGDDE